MRPRLPLIFALLLTLPFAAVQAAQTRVALVIGNGGYQSLKTLANPGNDAAAVAKKLSGLGFTLIGADGNPTQGPVLNLGSDAFLVAVREFAKAARGAEIAFVYYAGHGMQIGGNPYLLPVDVPRTDIDLIQQRSRPLEDVLRQLDGKAELTLAVFDACREIPELQAVVGEAMRDTGLGMDAYRGLGRVQQPGRQRIVAYSAAAGRLASDGQGGPHSPYTEALLAELDQPGREVGDLFRQVAWRMGPGPAGQGPEVLIQGVPPGRFYLVPVGPGPGPIPPPPLALGHLQVSLDAPTGVAAQVLVDGDLRGRAAPGQPLNVSNLPVGRHQIEARPDGLATVLQEVEVQSGRWAHISLLAPPPPVVSNPGPTPVTQTSVGGSTPDSQTEDALGLSAARRHQVQAWLLGVGQDPGGVDGAFGPGTRRAITAWQRASGLPASGYLNAEQFERLSRSLDANQTEEIYWNSIRSSNSVVMLNTFAALYPSGRYAHDARATINALQHDVQRVPPARPAAQEQPTRPKATPPHKALETAKRTVDPNGPRSGSNRWMDPRGCMREADGSFVIGFNPEKCK